MVCELSDEDLNRLFPAFIKTDGAGLILDAGPSLRRHAGADIVGQSILEPFTVQRPLGTEATEELLIHKQTCTLTLRAMPAVCLQGAAHRTGDAFYFLLGHIPSLEDQPKVPVYRFTDFAPFDGAKDMLLSAQIRKGLLRDVQDLVEQLKKEKAAAEAANSAKGEFLACMSHEIRTPLNGVLGLAALLGQTGLDTRQAQLLQSLRECGISLLDLLNDIIDIARMDTVQFEIQDESVDLEALLASLHDRYTILADGKDVEFAIVVDPSLRGLKVLSDRGRLAQVLNNLISNAVKFTDKGQVRLLADPFGQDGEDAQRVRFQIQDTGIGIAPEDVAQIFEPFTQADAGITRQFGGTGLGLTISQRIVDAMGGQISVDSDLGVGSTFTVTLPLKEVDEVWAPDRQRA